MSIIESEGENNCTSLETDHDKKKMATHEGKKAEGAERESNMTNY